MYKNLFNYKKYKTPKGFTMPRETAIKIGNANRGKENKGTRGDISKEIILNIRKDKKNMTNNELSIKYNIPFRTIRSIVENKTYKYYL